MKKILTIALALFVTNAWAQLDRSKLPEPSPAKEIKIGDYDKFTLKNGLQVILVENHKLPTIGWTLSFSTGTITEGDKAGYTSMFGQVMRAGTTSRSKEVLDEEIDFMGANINVGRSSISGFSLSKYKEQVLELMTDILYNPAFPEEELERAKTQSVSALATSKDDPSTISAVVSSVLNYGHDHTYGEISTEETIKNVSMDDLKNHYSNYFKPNIAYLVIVGDIKKKDAQKLAKKYFEKWERGDVQKEEFKTPKEVEKTIVAMVDRPASVQSVINITYPIDNKPGSADVTKLSVLDQILGGSGLATRLNMNLREDKGYTYGANSDIGSSRYSATFSAGASVRNEVTDSAVVQFVYELNRLRNELVDQKELDLAKNYLRGNFARSLESRNTVASFALNTQLNNLPSDYYANYLKRLDAITAADIQDVAQRYITPDKAHIVVVGKAEDIAEKLKQFGELKYYDSDGFEYDPEAAKAAVASVSANDVIAKYVEALGGADKLKEVTDMSVTITAGFQGQTLTIKSLQKGNTMSNQAVLFGTFEIQKAVFNNGQAKVTAQGQSQDVAPGPELESLKEGAVMFPELFYGETGHTLEVKGIEKVNGEDAYAMVITSKSGSSTTAYFSLASGLKLKEDLGAQGAQEVTEYQEVNGIMVPKKMKLTIPGAGVVEGEVAVEINTGLSDDIFKLN